MLRADKKMSTLTVVTSKILPACVNLQALPTRLWNIWMMRPISPITWGTDARTSFTIFTPRMAWSEMGQHAFIFKLLEF